MSRGLTAVELAGGFGLPGTQSSAAPLTGRIEDSSGRQLAALPDQTRRLLQLAAADPSGNRHLVWRAAGQLGIPVEAATPAVEAGLVEFGGPVRFRHPLVPGVNGMPMPAARAPARRTGGVPRAVLVRHKREVQRTAACWLLDQLVALAACSMTVVTVCGSVIMDKCPACTRVMRAPARWAMRVSSAGGITWSVVPITAQDGTVFHAGVPEGSFRALAASGRWVAAMAAAWPAGRPEAKQLGTRLGLM